MAKGNEFLRVEQLAVSTAKQYTGNLQWMWGDALLGYALSELDAWNNEDRYLSLLQNYCDHYVANPPHIFSSDTSAPALITYAMQKKTQNASYKQLTDRVLHYIRCEPRIMDDVVNHLGSSNIGKLYPKSIWVDSLMMFSVFPARYAHENNDRALLDFAARQPGLFAGYLQDKDDKLWYHSYWVKAHTHYPKKKIFWGRGNGWVICALPMILDHLPADHPQREEIIGILQSTSEALLPLQRDDGYFDTILKMPGKTYRESSATMLIAAGWLHGVRRGVLDAKFKAPAIKAFQSVISSFINKGGEVFMPEISGPTIPLPLFPLTGYKLVKTGRNKTYGVASAIFAAIEYQKLLGNKETTVDRNFKSDV